MWIIATTMQPVRRFCPRSRADRNPSSRRPDVPMLTHSYTTRHRAQEDKLDKGLKMTSACAGNPDTHISCLHTHPLTTGVQL